MPENDLQDQNLHILFIGTLPCKKLPLYINEVHLVRGPSNVVPPVTALQTPPQHRTRRDCFLGGPLNDL